MSIFEFAMQMEQDGEKLYRELAEKSSNTGLKKIFTNLANDEADHYNVFKKVKEYSSLDVTESTILADSKNIFAAMRDSGDITSDSEQQEAYRTALELEKKSYEFYEQKASETNVPAESKLLLTIAKEERRHYRLLEGVLDFIARPEAWLENAEFVHLTEY